MGLIKYCNPSSPTKKVSMLELLVLVAVGFIDRQDVENNNKNIINRVILLIYTILN
tara:strand:+ start:397 stop:564 length:168 start_codon:yes stop_codon:yes gene_type:complete